MFLNLLTLLDDKMSSYEGNSVVSAWLIFVLFIIGGIPFTSSADNCEDRLV